MNLSLELVLLCISCLLQFIILLLFYLKSNDDHLAKLSKILSENDIRQDQLIRSEFKNNREELQHALKDNQQLIIDQMKLFGNHQNQWFQSFNQQMQFLAQNQSDQLEIFRKEMTVGIKSLQEDNHSQLEKMRETVDEKLQKTLENRLGKSFESVSKHLEAVQRGLGEMQSLASGVGDLKKVLTNVKTRGVMGEMLLGNILEQILSPEQYSLNVKTIPHSAAHVEFAIKFPGNDAHEVWLPIDSKFPMDKYEKLIDAYDNGTPETIDLCQANLVKTVISMAKDISEKYISPPHTTNFGVMFLPVEGLYAEIVRNTVLMAELQNKYKIMLAGPTNLAAFLNSLQMGFKTIAIEKRSSEVWNILSVVKTEFGKFGETLEKVQDKLVAASKSIDDVGVRTRALQRNLKNVDIAPLSNVEKLM